MNGKRVIVTAAAALAAVAIDGTAFAVRIRRVRIYHRADGAG